MSTMSANKRPTDDPTGSSVGSSPAKKILVSCSNGEFVLVKKRYMSAQDARNLLHKEEVHLDHQHAEPVGQQSLGKLQTQHKNVRVDLKPYLQVETEHKKAAGMDFTERIQQLQTQHKEAEAEMRKRIDQLEKRHYVINSLLMIVNRCWNQLDEDMGILLQRFDAETAAETTDSSSSQLPAFLKLLSTSVPHNPQQWQREEVFWDKKFEQRVEFSKRAVGKLLQAFDRMFQKNEKLLIALEDKGKNAAPNLSLEEVVNVELISDLRRENKQLHNLVTGLHKRHHEHTLKLSASEMEIAELKKKLQSLWIQSQQNLSKTSKCVSYERRIPKPTTAAAAAGKGLRYQEASTSASTSVAPVNVSVSNTCEFDEHAASHEISSFDEDSSYTGVHTLHEDTSFSFDEKSDDAKSMDVKWFTVSSPQELEHCHKTVLRQHEISTHSKFIIREGFNKNEFGSFEVNGNKKRVYFDAPDIMIPSRGVPFLIMGVKRYDCYRGNGRKKKGTEQDHRYGSKKRKPQKPIKVGCPAVCCVHHLVYFPEFKIDKDTLHKRRTSSSKLRTSLQAGNSVYMEHKLYFRLSSHHENHLNGEDQNLPIDKKVSAKIKDLFHKHGVRNTAEMSRHLEVFVASAFPYPISKSNTSYYPRRQVLKNHINKHKRKIGEVETEESKAARRKRGKTGQQRYRGKVAKRKKGIEGLEVQYAVAHIM